MNNALLTAREIHGPYVQLHTNLQGENGHEWLEALKMFNRKENPWNAVQRESTRLAINYALTLAEMIAAGRYDWTDSDITAKRFPINGSGVILVERKLFHFDHTVSSDEAERLIIAAGWQPGKIEHLLASGAANPDEQRKFPIVALGSVAEVRGERVVASLGRDGSVLDLGLYWRRANWNGFCRFLAVRNSVL